MINCRVAKTEQQMVAFGMRLCTTLAAAKRKAAFDVSPETLQNRMMIHHSISIGQYLLFHGDLKTETT
jgi:hypothetical protein